jgi:hypothetical protein
MSGFWDDAELIHSYTRRQAIADGVLVDMEQDELGQLRREAGVKWPIAMTATAFSQYVELTPAAVKAGNDMKGLWWDILTMWKDAVRNSNVDGAELLFRFLCVVDRQKPTLVTLKAVAGPDDDGQPCLTFMLPEED